MEAQVMRVCPAHTAILANGHVSPDAPTELLDRMPPANLEAEGSLLCCLLLDPKRMEEITGLVRIDDFYDIAHQALYCIMQHLWDKGQRDFDLRLVRSELRQSQVLDEHEESVVLAEIMMREATAVHARHYADQVVALAQRRRWLRTATDLIRRIWSPTSNADISQFVSQALTDFYSDDRMGRAYKRAITIAMSDVISERLQWLWPGRIALGKLTLIAGDPGLGKSFVSLDLASRVSRGDIWPDNPATSAPKGDVLLLNAEDGLADTVRPRLDAAGADAKRIVALTAVRDPTLGERGFSLARDLTILCQELDRRPETRLIIIDPVTAYLGGGNGNNNAEVRSLLTPLSQLAQERQVAVVAITHLNKNSGGKAMYRAMGSLAFVAAARAAWGVVRDPHDAERRLFLPVKNNLSQETQGLAYRLVMHPELGTAHVGWFPELVTAPIDDILQSSNPGVAGDAAQEARSATTWLADILSQGSQSADDLRHLADKEGFTPKQLRYAADKLGVKRRKDGFLEGWTWSLP
jgi:putative DNA primase/helicase